MRSQIIGIVFAIAAVPAIGFLLWSFLRPQLKPDEIERRRRLAINVMGKLGDAEVIDFEGSAIVYSYSVSGVGYTAAQDAMALETLLPPDQASMLGPALVKFDPRNPANSIVVCEDWSGLRCRR